MIQVHPAGATEMLWQVTPQEVEAWRDIRYRRRPDLRVRSEEEALSFLNDVGLATLFSSGDVELPNLWEAIVGGERPLPEHHDDHDLGLTWDWKDTLPGRKAILYGKFLRKRPVFIALDVFPHFYALSGNYGELDDYLEEYHGGRLSEEARRIYESLQEHGPLPTSVLRRVAKLAGKESAPRFDRAIAELQMGFKIVKVGISDANRWGYCYVYDLLIRQFPDQVAAAREISEDRAANVILMRYLQTVLVANQRQVRLLFGWEGWRVERAVERLSEGGAISVQVGEERGFVGARAALEGMREGSRLS
jgi:hypothetical protein